MTGRALRRPSGSLLRTIGLFAAGAALAGCLWSTTGRDDVHITYWEAHTLVESGALANYNGDPVEQSSTLLSALLLALLHLPGLLSLPTLGLLLSLAAWLACALWIDRATGAVDSRQRPWAVLLVATSPYLAYWAWSGMEVSLYAFLLLATALWMGRALSERAFAGRRWLEGGVLFAGLLLARPEAGVVLGTAIAGCALAWAVGALGRGEGSDAPVAPRAGRRLAWMAGLCVLLALAVASGRLWTFGLPFPNPVLAKADGVELAELARGGAYLRQFVLTRPGALLLALGAGAGALRLAAALRRREAGVEPPGAVAAGIAAASLLAANALFVVAVGGDWMEAGRFLAPVVPLAVLLLVHALAHPRLPDRGRRAAAALLLAANLAGLYVVVAGKGTGGPAHVGSTGRPLWTLSQVPAGARERFSFAEWSNRVNLRDLPVAASLGPALEHAAERLGRPIRILSGQMGLVAYHVARAHPGAALFLDRNGLATRQFQACPLTASAARTRAGLHLPVEALLEAWPRLTRACDLEPPDLVYELGPATAEVRRRLRRHGYRVVYSRLGTLPSGSRWARGAPVLASQYVAARAEIVRHLPQPFVDERLLARQRAGPLGSDSLAGMKLAAVPEGLLERVAHWRGELPTPVVETLQAALLARTILVGTKVGVFEALREGPRGAEEVAKAVGCDARATGKLLAALTGAGYLEQRHGRFALAPVAREWMLAESPRSLRDSTLFGLVEWELLGRYEDFLRTGRPLEIHASEELDAEGWSLYQRGMRSRAGLSAEEIARRCPAPERPRAMLDIGGSHGFNSVCFCRRHPELRATILDLPEAVEQASSLLQEEGLGDRVAHRPGNVLDEDLGTAEWDLVFVAQLVHHFGDGTNRELAARVARALKPGGVFAVVEVERPHEPGATGQLGALMDLYFALTSESGTWSVPEIQGWQRDAGLEVLEPRRLRTLPGGVLQPARRG